jgi:hypothetical protein
MIFILLAILIPLIWAFGLLVAPSWPLSNPINRKRFIIQISSSVLIALILNGMLYGFGLSKMFHKEVWNMPVLSVKYEEKWTEKESRTRQVPCGTDSKGNVKYRTEIYYVTETYGPYWTANVSSVGKEQISKSDYMKWSKIWSNEKKVGVHKGSATGFNKAITGNIYQASWKGEFEKLYPWSTFHKYINKVRESENVFKFKEPSEELKKKYPRPADKNNSCPIFGYGYNINGKDILTLRRVNATLGPSKQIHIITILTNGDRGVIDDILSAWGGPNKNELVIFAGIQSDIVRWIDVYSWLDNTELHGIIESSMVDKKYSTDDLAKILLSNVPKKWKRKEFKDFDYMSVDIGTGWVVFAFILSAVTSVISFVIINHKIK